MRPTIDEQLAGVQRLLGLVEADGGIPPESVELLHNAQRLVKRVAASWSTSLPFLLDDNAQLSALLREPAAAAAPTDVAVAAARNDELRGSLSHLIRNLPCSVEGRARRAEIGRYLSRRVAADPT